MKMLQKICFVLLLMTTFSSVYGGECAKDNKVDDWCRVKAEQGNAVVQTVLGHAYKDGDGVLQNQKEALKWYRKAAEQGHSSAQSHLGYMYYKGQGVLQDYVMAHMYWNIASVSGNERAIEGRDLIVKEMTPSQIEESQDLAREWMRNHQ